MCVCRQQRLLLDVNSTSHCQSSGCFTARRIKGLRREATASLSGGCCSRQNHVCLVLLLLTTSNSARCRFAVFIPTGGRFVDETWRTFSKHSHTHWSMRLWLTPHWMHEGHDLHTTMATRRLQRQQIFSVWRTTEGWQPITAVIWWSHGVTSGQRSSIKMSGAAAKPSFVNIKGASMFWHVALSDD